MKKISLTIVYSIIFCSVFSQDYSVYFNPTAEECGSFQGYYNYTYTDSSLIISGYSITNSCAIPQTTISVDKSSQYPELLITFTDTSEYLCDCNSPRSCTFEIFDIFDTVSITTLGSAYIVDTLMSREMSLKEPCTEPDTAFIETFITIEYPATVGDLNFLQDIDEEYKKFNNYIFQHEYTETTTNLHPDECSVYSETVTITIEEVLHFNPQVELRKGSYAVENNICFCDSTYTLVAWDSILMTPPVWYTDSLMTNRIHEGNSIPIQPDSAGEYTIYAVREYNDSAYIKEVTYTAIAPTTNIHSPTSNNIQVYPNPVQDYVYIESDEIVQEVYVCNIQGNFVQTFSNTSTIPLQEIPAGTYTIYVITESSRHAQFLVKE